MQVCMGIGVGVDVYVRVHAGVDEYRDSIILE